MNRLSFFAGLSGFALLACGACGPAEGAHSADDAPLKCEEPQPDVTDVRWLGLASAPRKVPLSGIPAEVKKVVALEDGIEITTRQVEYTPVAEDQNVALALIEIRRGQETKEVRLARRLPGGPVCYQQAAGLWVGLVETVPNKAMVRIGVPPPPPPAERK